MEAMAPGKVLGMGVLAIVMLASGACGNESGSPVPGVAGAAGGQAGSDNVTSTGGAPGAGGSFAGGGQDHDATTDSVPSADASTSADASPSIDVSTPLDATVAEGGSSVDAGRTVSPATGSGMWLDLARIPGARSDGSGAVVNGLLLVVGGQGAIGQDVEAYNPQTNTWETQVKLPFSVNHANVAGVGDKLYVMGGRDSDATYMYNPLAPMAARKWTPIATIPAQRESASVGVIGNKIYLAGGAVSHVDPPRAELFVYDPATDTWDTSGPPMPAGRTHTATAVINDILYIAAGRIYAERFTDPTGWVSTTYAYDPRAKQWTQKNNAPTARSGCVGAALKGLLIVAGGEGAPTGNGTFPQVEAYNPDTDQWTTLAPMKHPRNGQAEGSIADKMYTAGGTNTDITDVFTLP
jgi:N-acetylneuraminic acid mutarotase